MTAIGFRRGVLAVIVVLWVVSLALPAVRAGAAPALTGLDVLLRGWRAFEFGVYAWFANPAFLTAVVLGGMRRYAAASVLAGVGCVLALTSFAAGGIAASAGTPVPEPAMLAGFYGWLASQFALLACCARWAARTRDAVER